MVSGDSTHDLGTPGSRETLDDVIAKYIRAEENGEAPDRDELLSRYSQYASELEEFFVNRERMEQLASPLRSELQPGPRLGTVRYFGDYELVQEIARGGMGVVYRARQVSLNREVALKMVVAGRFAGKSDLERFRVEAEAAAALDHPHIVPIYEVGEHEEQQYFSMKLVNGESLARRLHRDIPAPRDAARLVSMVASAVQHAHERGVLHRDLKPGNILLDAAGAPHVTDFGLAKKLDRDSDLTLSGVVVGTPSYMAPEQASGRSREVAPTTDVWGLGAILYHALSGRPPFQADESVETLRLVREGEPVPPRTLVPRLPRDLETICLKCLEKEPRRRYASAGELALELERFLRGEPIAARPITIAGRAWRWCRRRPVVASLSAAVVLALVAGTIVSNHFAIDSRRSLNLARERLELVRLGAYDTQLSHVRAVVDEDPDLALELLEDPEQCPEDLRDFAWRALRHRAQPYRLLPARGAHRVLFSPDGATLAMIGPSTSLVDLRDGSVLTLKRRIRNRGDSAFSPTGDALFGVGSGVIGIWECSSGDLRSLFRLPDTAASLSSPTSSLSADGTILAHLHAKTVRTKDGRRNIRHDPTRIMLFDVTTRSYIDELPHDVRIVATAFSADGTKLAAVGTATRATARSPTEVYIWDLERRERVRVKAPTTACQSLALTRDGRVVALGSPDGQITLWDGITGARKAPVASYSGPIEALAFSPDGRTLASVSPSADRLSTLKLWDVGTGRLLEARPGHPGRATDLAFSPDGASVAVGGRSVTLWDVRRRVLVGHKGEVHAVAASADGAIFSAGIDRTVRIWDASSGAVRRQLDAHDAAVNALALSADGRALASADQSGTVNLWSLTEEGEPASLSSHEGAIWALAFSPDGETLASAGDDLVIRLHDPARRRQLAALRGHSLAVYTLAFSPSGFLLASAGLDHDVILWDLSKNRLAARLAGSTGRVWSLCFSPDGHTLVSTGSDGVVWFWDVESGAARTTFRGYGTWSWSAAFSADGKTLALGGDDGKIRLCSSSTGQLRADLKGHVAPVLALDFVASALVSASADGTIRVWDHHETEDLGAAAADLRHRPTMSQGGFADSAERPPSLTRVDLQAADAVTRLRDQLEGANDAATRQNALRDLLRIAARARGAAPAAAAALGDRDATVRRYAARFLGRVGSPVGDAAVRALLEALADESPAVRRYAEWALRQIGHEAVPILSRRVNEAEADVRAIVTNIVREIAALSSAAKTTLEPNSIGSMSSVGFRQRPGDWPMWGGSPSRNNVNQSDRTVPHDWDIATGRNIKWTADLGSQTFGNPVVAEGRIFISTNNGRERNPKIKGDRGVVMCFREADGEFLWQATHDKLAAGRVNDWPEQGVASTPVVEEGRLYYVSNRCELVCADVEGFRDGENNGMTDEKYEDSIDADLIWVLDMIGELGVFPHNLAISSPLVAGEMVYVIMGNGVGSDHVTVPSPTAPSFIAVNKRTGAVVWQRNDPGADILHGQWSSPAWGIAGGTPQVVFPGGDGWLYSCEPRTGELIWSFDCNPKNATWELGGRGTRNSLVAPPSFVDGRVYIAVGQDPEHGDGIGHLYSIDASGVGDVTETHVVWHVGGEDFGRSISTCAVHDGLVYAADLRGFLYCFDASTGKQHWVHDLLGPIWSSPSVIGDKVYIGDEDGEVVVVGTGKALNRLTESEDGIDMEDSVYSIPVAANGVLYITTRSKLYAIEAR